MMDAPWTQAELEAYLDEALPTPHMAAIEASLRSDESLVQQLVQINTQRDAGQHSLAAIWRRFRLSCPTRGELGSYLLGVSPPDQADYIRFHLEDVGCRACEANRIDLQRQHSPSSDADSSRRRKYFQSSAGYLREI